MGSQSHIHLRRAKEVPDGAPKQARWTPIVPIAQNRSSVRLHCRIVHKHPLLLLTAVSRPLLAISPCRSVAGASCARKFRVDIRTSYRPPEGLPARRSAGPRGGCGVLCLLHVVCVLYDRDQRHPLHLVFSSASIWISLCPSTFVAARGPAPCVNSPDQPHQHQTMRLALLILLALYFVFVATSQPERHFIL